MDERGSISVEAACVMPLVIGFVGVLVLLNVNVFIKTVKLTSVHSDVFTNYVGTHRAVSAVFDSGENIYEILFG